MQESGKELKSTGGKKGKKAVSERVFVVGVQAQRSMRVSRHCAVRRRLTSPTTSMHMLLWEETEPMPCQGNKVRYARGRYDLHLSYIIYAVDEPDLRLRLILPFFFKE